MTMDDGGKYTHTMCHHPHGGTQKTNHLCDYLIFQIKIGKVSSSSDEKRYTRFGYFFYYYRLGRRMLQCVCARHVTTRSAH